MEEAEEIMDILFYVGTYTGKSKGIYLCKLDSSSGAMSIVDTTGGVENPSFLALHPSKKYLYAACENYGPDGGSVAGFAINRSTGKLTPINQQSSKGAGPCYVSCDPSGKVVVAANYGGGSVVCLPTLSNGKLGPATGFDQHTGSSINKQRQGEPHAHSAYVDPSGKWAVSCDLGTDKIYIYRLDATKGTITPNDPPAMLATPGAGPRHFAFHPNNRFAYAINELNNTVTAYTWDNIKGRLEVIGSASSLPNNFEGENTTAEVQVHPTGRFSAWLQSRPRQYRRLFD